MGKNLALGWYEINKKRKEIGRLIEYPMTTKKAWEIVLKCVNFNNKKILDVGCSNGEFFLFLKKKGINFDGIGYDVDRSIAKVIDFPLYHDLRKINEKFDIITMFEVIEHMYLDELIKLIKKLKKLLKRDGILIISTRNIASLRESWEFWYDITHLKPYPYKDLISVLSFFGFKFIKLVRIECSLNPFVVFLSLLLRKDWCNGYVCFFKKI